jgi:hypothetical protein
MTNVIDFSHIKINNEEESHPELAKYYIYIYVDHCSISRIVAIRNCCFLLDYFKEVR